MPTEVVSGNMTSWSYTKEERKQMEELRLKDCKETFKGFKKGDSVNYIGIGNYYNIDRDNPYTVLVDEYPQDSGLNTPIACIKILVGDRELTVLSDWFEPLTNKSYERNN